MKTRKTSPLKIMQAHIDRIERLNPTRNAFVTLIPERALDQAREAERRIGRREAGPLEDLPLAVKDLVDFLEGVRNTLGSVPMRDLNLTPHTARSTSSS